MRFELSQENLDRLINVLEEKTKEYPIVLLRGNLGAGKTTLVQEFAKKRGIKDVTSPTFSIEHIYGDEIYHYDLYQTPFEKFLELGLFSELESEGVHFIEWADENLENLLKMSGMKYMIVEIEPKNDKRVYRIKNA